MASTTARSTKAAQDRAQREQKAESGAALPGGVTVKKAGRKTTKAEQQAEVQTIEQAVAEETKANSGSVEVREVAELPKTTRSAPTRSGPSPWALRLDAVTKTKTGVALIYSCDKATTANAAAYRVRKALKAGRYNDVLGEDAAKHFLVEVRGTDIYAVHRRAA